MRSSCTTAPGPNSRSNKFCILWTSIMGDHFMHMRIIFIFGLLLMLGVATLAVSMDIRIQEWKFDKDAQGSIPAGFVPGKLNSEAGRWQVANDPKAPSAPHVLVWQGTDQAAKDQII